ncbi:MAG: P-II family nitrogen regulator [Bacillota bacterium]
MKKIECIIQPGKLIELEDRLIGVVAGLTVTPVNGFGSQKGDTHFHQGQPLLVQLKPKMKVEMVVADNQVEEVISILVNVCRTGKIGDGKIFILPVDEAIRIRTGDRGEKALSIEV